MSSVGKIARVVANSFMPARNSVSGPCKNLTKNNEFIIKMKDENTNTNTSLQEYHKIVTSSFNSYYCHALKWCDNIFGF